ncbi:MAG: glycosyltransferase family 9 protein [Bdellovibrionales bacterium]|jgi:ADP-heptose:LPS heptosyltransferase|nr:glycosyltransferase family 9 protein [Bdellovibrionales bacterium]
MRIVLLSMLRIGDTMMHLEIVEGLKQKFPDADIEFIINDEFSQLIPLLSRQVSRVHLFPRTKAQLLIKSRTSHLEEPIWILNDWLTEVQSSEIDLVINLTHTRVSGYLMGLLSAKNKIGLVIGNGKTQLIGNEWLRYLNEHFASGFRSQFHYIDVLSQICEIEVRRKAAEIRNSRRIFIQPLTSDAKKNWALSKWKTLFTELCLALPEYSIKVLASPAEFSLLHGLFHEEELAVLSLDEAAEALQSAELLISGDTSLVHLATQTRTRTLMIALGSSDSIKTGPYLDGSVVISARAECRPCDHTKPCFQPSHLCGQSITVDQILTLAKSYLKTDSKNSFNLQGGSDLHGQETRKPLRDPSQEARNCL